MLSQELLYQSILRRDWDKLLKTLYRHKKEIANDALLTQAAKTFENEFFNNLNGLNHGQAVEQLDTLYQLHHGKFYVLKQDNYKSLVMELVNRKPLTEAFNFAKLFPHETASMQVIAAHNVKYPPVATPATIPTGLTMNWIEIYNRIFELVNDQGNSATYFSGSKFINVVRETNPYFPDYGQYIALRNQQGKSTSRKIFYYDILMGLGESQRVKVVDRILEMLKPFEPSRVTAIERLLGKASDEKKVDVSTPVPVAAGHPVVFISYSWDDEAHKKWVLNLANRLRANGVDVVLDRYYLKPGKSLPHFVETSIAKAHRVVIIFTPNYKLKADGRRGGVGYEYSIMNAELYNAQTTNDKVIPVLRAGSKEESIPTFMQQFIHIDVRKDENFENSYLDLIREIYNQPAIEVPQLGVKPDFKAESAEVIALPDLGGSLTS